MSTKIIINKLHSLPIISVIVTTKNEENNIRNCLESIRKQTYPKNSIETIVVDNNSTDKTKEIASEYTHLVFNKGPERSAQRNYGVKKSQSNYFMYVDADMILSPNLIKETVKTFKEDQELIALYVPEIVMGEKFWSKVRKFERSFYNGTVIDCVRIIKKEDFLKTGGFDKSISGPEDWDLDKKIRRIGKVSIIKSPIYHNESGFNLKLYLSKKSYYAKSFDSYINKWGTEDPDIKKQFGLWYRYFGVFTEKGKWKKIFLHPVLSFAMYFLRFLVGLKYLQKKLSKNQYNQKNNLTKVLIITPFFLPNIGGAETYAFELCEYLRKNGCFVNVLTYQPITTSKVRGAGKEYKENMMVRRYQWIGFNLFHTLEKFPLINFFYLTPYLFIRSFIWMLFNNKNVDIIDAQGFNSAFVAVVLKKIFKKKAIISVMSLYDFVPNSNIAKFVTWIISKLDHVIVESEVSKLELINIGIPAQKITSYVEWVDLELFRPYNKKLMKKELGWKNKFSVLFVGRALKIKGAHIILETARKLKNLPIQFIFISNAGPMMDELRKAQQELPNVLFIPGVPYHMLAKYESAADLAVVPSKYSENSAITAVTAVACGTPVIASDKGAIPDLLSETVGIVVPPKTEKFTEAIKKIFDDRVYYQSLQKNCRSYAENKFSLNNAQTILNVYYQNFK